jgi:hypothetical protein
MRIFTLLFITLMLSRCGKDIPPPTYLHIDEFVLDPNIDVNYGQLTHAFMDVYVYIDNQNFGVFPLPCTIPLNLEGAHELRLMPAVRANGQSGSKIRYPFVEHHVQLVNFQRLDTIHIQPRTQYYSTTQVWFEDFEDASLSIQSTPLSLVDMVKSNDPDIIEARNGNFFGKVMLNATENIWDGITNANWSLNPNQPAFLELDFYNTNSIQTGLRSTGSGGINNLQHVLIVPQKPEDLRWRKMYIDLRQLVAAVGIGNTFNLMLVSILEQGATENVVAIDNIKLVYR